ncbi:MAG: TonB-dependent receptor [Calditrichaeota bacterium]|nr:MAG: TonB-dependent receptor [Calditrichota bacterium]
MSANLAAGLTVSDDGQNRRSLFSPEVKIVLAPSQKFMAIARFNRGFQYVTWFDRLDLNPFVRFSTIAFPEQVDWNYQARVQWQLSKTWMLEAGYARKKILHYNFFERDSTGVFALRAADARFGEFSLGTHIDLSSRFAVEATLMILEDALFQGGQYLTLIDFPYRPEMRLPAALIYSPGAAWKMKFELLWMGSRKTTLARQKELPSFVDASLQVNYQFGQKVTVFARVKNLLDENYQLWEGYREMGVHAILGVEAKW